MGRQMKDSGVEWIGKIPESWDAVKFKTIMYKKKELCSHYDNQNILSLTMNGVIVRDLDNPKGKMPATFDGYQIVNKGNLLLCLFDIDVTPRCVGLIKDDGLTSPAYSQYVLRNDNHPKFYDYFLTYLDNKKALLHLTKSLRNTLTDSDFGVVKTVLPPLEEQERITNFLDQKVSQIDTIIENTKVSIGEFKKYKQALITETVTKGLNPNVEMKDSGVEWIGKIPEHLKLGKIKLLTTKIGSGKTPKGGADVYSDSGILFLRSQNVYNTGLYLDEATYISEEIDLEMKNTRVYPNDVLLNITGGSIGRCCIYPPTMVQHANVNQHVCIIRTIEDKITSKYLFYFLCSNAGQSAINFYQTGANREGLNFEQIGNIKIPSPTVEEQNEIVAFLDAKCSFIDSLIEQKQQIIKEFEDYKKSLIYEYVTGKKEVL